jgi:Protein of unknown function (DUF3631)/CHC2 zinc finger
MKSEIISRAKSVPIERIIEERQIKLRGHIERVGPCPKCGGVDRFSINTKKQVWNCRGCDVGGDVIKLVEHLDDTNFTSAVQMFAGEPPPKVNGKDRKEFLYTDASGTVLFATERIEDGTVKDGKRRKTFRQKRPDPDHPGQWIWNTEGVPVVPYQLPHVIKSIATNRPVLIVEGEQKADLLWSWNVAATCNAGGAKKWKPQHAEFLRGADVVLVPDHDNAGWEHIHAVGASLVGIAKRVRVLVLPHAKAKDDVVDWAKAGGTREQLDELLDKAQDWKPTPSADAFNKQNEDEKAKAKAREDALLDALAKAEGLDYERQRKAAAKELKVSARAIDNEVKARREDAQAAPLYGHWIVEPWPKPVEGDSLLRDIIKRIKRHVIISDDGALTIALWIMLSWVHDEIATHSPILNINSAEPESGKSTTMSLVAFLMPKCIASVEASEAAIYRAIKRWSPSFCFDEFDSILADDDKAALRSVINSGHTRGQGVLRCIGDDKVPELFPTFAPKAIGMVGRKLPPATLSRCIFVELRRCRRDEPFEKFKHVDDADLADLRRRLFRWSMDSADTLRNASVSMPAELPNRRADNWKLQLLIADLAGADWGDKARAAAVKIETGSDSRTANVKALAAIKTVFDGIEGAVIGSEDLIRKITADPDSDWVEWKSGKPITQKQLASLLKRYGIAPEQVRIDGHQVRGYWRAHFTEAWERYL